VGTSCSLLVVAGFGFRTTPGFKMDEVYVTKSKISVFGS
jgi:hypothetical protein